jgi:hypothetical protein
MRTNTRLTAHWDHLGVGTPVKGDAIYNGALDNASGMAALLEIAGAFTKVEPKPKRSVLFLMVTAEEQGLLGSQHYSVSPLYPLERTVANINIDLCQSVWRAPKTLSSWVWARRIRMITAQPPVSRGFDDHPGMPSRCRGSNTDRTTSTSRSRASRRSIPISVIDYAGKPPDTGRRRRDGYTGHGYHAPSDLVKPD